MAMTELDSRIGIMKVVIDPSFYHCCSLLVIIRLLWKYLILKMVGVPTSITVYPISSVGYQSDD